MDEKEFSIFVDESGSFDSLTVPSRFYIVSFVIHEQSADLTRLIAELDACLAYLGHPGICIHTGPLIRREEIFRLMDVHERQQIFFRLLAFALHAPITHHSFVIDKRYSSTPTAMEKSLRDQISAFLANPDNGLPSDARMKIYYDNGQPQVSRILKVAFSETRALFVGNVSPSSYRLFQVADLVCSAELLNLKLREGIPLTKSEQYFFPQPRVLKKNVLRPLARIRI